MRYKVKPIKMSRPTVPVAVDIVILHEGKIVLMKRAINPYKGFYTLPGGFVIPGQTTRETCVKETKEETGLDVEIEKMIGIFDNPERDPRGHTISVAYLCKPVGGKLKPQKTEASEVRLFTPEEIKKMELGFDHKQIIKEAGLI